MDSIFPIYFKMLDFYLKDNFNNIPTPEFTINVIETRDKLKLTFSLDEHYLNYCKIIDKKFEEYLSQFQCNNN